MLQNILAPIGTFSESNIALFESYLEPQRVAKNDILLHEGEVCHRVFLVLRGAFYQFQVVDVEEQIIDLHLAQQWLLNHSSFMTQTPSSTTIKAFTDSEVLGLSIQSIHELIAISPIFLQLGKILDQNTARTHFFDNSLSPLQKYQYVMKQKPQLLHTFPLKMIASYLKITPETLSRVRSAY